MSNTRSPSLFLALCLFLARLCLSHSLWSVNCLSCVLLPLSLSQVDNLVRCVESQFSLILVRMRQEYLEEYLALRTLTNDCTRRSVRAQLVASLPRWMRTQSLANGLGIGLGLGLQLRLGLDSRMERLDSDLDDALRLRQPQ